MSKTNGAAEAADPRDERIAALEARLGTVESHLAVATRAIVLLERGAMIHRHAPSQARETFAAAQSAVMELPGSAAVEAHQEAYNAARQHIRDLRAAMQPPELGEVLSKVRLHLVESGDDPATARAIDSGVRLAWAREQEGSQRPALGAALKF